MFSEILGHEVAVNYDAAPDKLPNGHYTVTPYSFQPRVGRKLTANLSVDMGQGILQILEQIHQEGADIDVPEGRDLSRAGS
jgi:UDP-glucose 4-epimerase